MLQTGQHASLRYVHCALRTRIAILRQQRLKHTAFREAKDISDDSFVAHIATGGRQFDTRPREPRSQSELGNGLIRKTWPANEYRPPRNANPRNQSSPQRAGAQVKDFSEALRSRLIAMKEELRQAPLLQQIAKEAKPDGDGEGHSSFKSIWKDLIQRISGKRDPLGAYESKEGQGLSIAKDLSKHYKIGGENALDGRIKYHFYALVTGARFSSSDINNQRSVADLRYPTEWFPATRTVSRTIHLHVGPTNSGKTYRALQRLEQAETGTYAGPLRLLAHEVFTRMNAKGRKCALITGEERRFSEESDGTEADDLTACTVEMVPLNSTLDVAVIDEIQMISSPERGWAWTQALLGVKAKEVHLCGEERTVPLIRELCASTGEKLEIHRYQRLSPLKVAETSLDGDLTKLRKGDCVVSFSVMGIHALRNQIEKVTGRKVAIVYGSLPPETRAQQARLFNEPNNDYDFLVASDAVGMGLNLAIKRVIFETTTKFDGFRRSTIGVADVKQIAGRAGRFRTAAQANEKPASEQDIAAAKGDVPEHSPASVNAPSDENLGLVTTMEKFDFPIVKSAMASEPEPITSAGIMPPAAVLVRFSSYFPPGTPFSFILTRLHELSKMHRRFHLCGLRDQIWIADLIEPVEGLTISDRNILSSAPASRSDSTLWNELMPALARCVAEQSGGNIVDIKELPLEILEAEVSTSREYLRELERLHKGVVTYLWLSYRFAGIFYTRPLAFHIKDLVEQKIEQVLSSISFSESRRKNIVARREKQLLRNLQLNEDLIATAETSETNSAYAHRPGPEYLTDGDLDEQPCRDASVFVARNGKSAAEDNDERPEADIKNSQCHLHDNTGFSIVKKLEQQLPSSHQEDRPDNEDIILDEPGVFEDDGKAKREEGQKDQHHKVSGS